MTNSTEAALGFPMHRSKEGSRTSFLDIPSEIRRVIYDLWLPEMTLEYGPKPQSTPNYHPETDDLHIDLSPDSFIDYICARGILILCRTIRYECLHLFRTKFTKLLPVKKIAIAKNPTTLLPTKLHRTVIESIDTFGFRDHIDPIPDYREFPNLRNLVVNIHQAHVSNSYHTMSERALIDQASTWLNIRSWQNQVIWKLLYEDGEEWNIRVNLIGTVGIIEGFDFDQTAEIDMKLKKVLRFRVVKVPNSEEYYNRPHQSAWLPVGDNRSLVWL